MFFSETTVWRARSGSFNDWGLNARKCAAKSTGRRFQIGFGFYLFCIACIALMGIVLTAYVYWGFQ